MQSEPGYYAVITSDVRYCQALPAEAKLLYGEIAALCNSNGYCWATNRYFAGLYKRSTRTIRRFISALRNEGFIEVEMDCGDGTPRKIRLAETQRKAVSRVLGEDKSVLGVGHDCPTGEDKSVLHNNTVNNTKNKKTVSPEILEVFDYWKTILEHPTSRLDDKRAAKIRARLSEGLSVEDLKKAIQGAKVDRFLMGANDQNKKYDGIQTIFRDRGKVEELMDQAPKTAPKTQGPNHEQIYRLGQVGRMKRPKGGDECQN